MYTENQAFASWSANPSRGVPFSKWWVPPSDGSSQGGGGGNSALAGFWSIHDSLFCFMFFVSVSFYHNGFVSFYHITLPSVFASTSACTGWCMGWWEGASWD